MPRPHGNYIIPMDEIHCLRFTHYYFRMCARSERLTFEAQGKNLSPQDFSVINEIFLGNENSGAQLGRKVQSKLGSKFSGMHLSLWVG